MKTAILLLIAFVAAASAQTADQGLANCYTNNPSTTAACDGCAATYASDGTNKNKCYNCVTNYRGFAGVEECYSQTFPGLIVPNEYQPCTDDACWNCLTNFKAFPGTSAIFVSENFVQFTSSNPTLDLPNNPFLGTLQQCLDQCTITAACAGFSRLKRLADANVGECYFKSALTGILNVNDSFYRTFVKVPSRVMCKRRPAVSSPSVYAYFNCLSNTGGSSFCYTAGCTTWNCWNCITNNKSNPTAQAACTN